MSAPPPILEPARGAPVLDYASPQSRSAFRLPANSVLRVTRTATELRVHETLSGKAGAVVALLFAVFTLLIILSVALPIARGRFPSRHVIDLSVLAILVIAEILTMLAVIDSTWRSTILLINAQEIAVRFRSPIRGSRFHKWPAERLHSAHIRHSRLQAGGPEFAELEFDFWGEAHVRLFLGHSNTELQQLIDIIHQIQPPAPPLRANVDVPSSPAP